MYIIKDRTHHRYFAGEIESDSIGPAYSKASWASSIECAIIFDNTVELFQYLAYSRCMKNFQACCLVKVEKVSQYKELEEL